MVSTRRRIVNEQDRFGGYSKQPNSRISLESETDETEITFSRRAEFDTENITPTRRMPELKQDLAPLASVVDYSDRTSFYPKTAEYVGPVSVPREVVKPKKREREDVMPSIKTRAYANDKTEREVKPHHKAKVSAKNKMILGIYMAVAAVLAVLVIATGIAVSNIGGEVSALEAQIMQKNQQLVSQSAEIDKLTDKNYIAGVALDKGMEKVTSTTEITLVPVYGDVTYEERTNWFDKFCDWLSKIIGG